MNRTLALAVAAIVAIVAFSGIAFAQAGVTYQASAVLKDPGGKVVGQAQFAETGSGPVSISVQVSGLSPGTHGIHIHEKGNCTGPGFTSAGEHYNPLHRHHGLDNPAGPHAGDLPNLVVGADGRGHLNTTTDRVTLAPGPTTLFTANGTSLVIHSGPDDQRSDPAGNSGTRIACGPIVAK